MTKKQNSERPDKTITVVHTEFARKLDKYLRAVEKDGVTIFVTKDGRPYGQLKPIAAA